jgi:A/G-specific adenine glycosylase
MEAFHKREIAHKSLKHWFQEEKRIFPWRQDPTPYQVWVSEVMLQQTQASVVVPYFKRWMERFPTVDALASAKEEEVVKTWEGLGYYSRARSLHAGAKYLLEHHQGELPQEPEALLKVKGIGPYTCGAIRSFAFHQKAAAVDGNVARVSSRLFCIEEEIDVSATYKKIVQCIEAFLPDYEPWVVMEALIELGASHCAKKPSCHLCPLQSECLARKLGKEEALPKRKERPKVTRLKREVFVIQCGEKVLVQRHEGKKIMSGLYEFPYLELGQPKIPPFPLSIKLFKSLPSVVHTFTRFRVELFPKIMHAEEELTVPGFRWVGRETLMILPFSSGHRKILKYFLEEDAHFTH